MSWWALSLWVEFLNEYPSLYLESCWPYKHRSHCFVNPNDYHSIYLLKESKSVRIVCIIFLFFAKHMTGGIYSDNMHPPTTVYSTHSFIHLPSDSNRFWVQQKHVNKQCKKWNWHGIQSLLLWMDGICIMYSSFYVLNPSEYSSLNLLGPVVYLPLSFWVTNEYLYVMSHNECLS